MQDFAGGESADLLAGNAFVAEARHRAEEAAREQAVDRGLADAEGGGGFPDGIGQAFDGRSFGSRRGRLRVHGAIIADLPPFGKRDR
jgi:hypothetical protein